MLKEIEDIFYANNKKYGSPRITIELQNRGYNVNKKRVARIMKENGIQAAKKKRRYNSYKGTVGKIAPNILDRNFSTTRPYEKLGTDVTVFITPHGKLYLSPVIDFHTREILAYDLSEHPNMMQIRRMLWNLTNKHGDSLKGAILHSDQGWQYQMLYYRKYLKEHSMIQSMSRKGNCLDNSPTENFFGRLKTEMYYDKEYSIMLYLDEGGKAHLNALLPRELTIEDRLLLTILATAVEYQPKHSFAGYVSARGRFPAVYLKAHFRGGKWYFHDYRYE